MMILVDEVDLIDGYKALVAAVPCGCPIQEACHLVFRIFTNQQIRDMVYRSKNDVIKNDVIKNDVIWNFMDQAHETIQKVIWEMESDREPVFIFDQGFVYL